MRAQPGLELQCSEDIRCLILESGCVSERVYNAFAADTNSAFNLVRHEFINQRLFDQLLRLVDYRRKYGCLFPQAAEAMRNYISAQVPIEDTLRRQFGVPIPKGVPTLGDLLESAQIITKANSLPVLERSLREGLYFGECLVADGLVSSAVIELCLQAQQLISSGVIDLQSAIEVIAVCVENRWSLPGFLIRTQALAEDTGQAFRLVNLLKTAAVISEGDLSEALVLTTSFCVGPTAALAITGKIKPNVYRLLWYYLRQAKQHIVRDEQVIAALQRLQNADEDIRISMSFLTDDSSAGKPTEGLTA